MMSESSLSLALSGSSSPLALLSAEQRQRLTTLLDEYLRAQEQAAPLNKQKLLAEHPDLAKPLETYFHSLEDLHALAAGCGQGACETPPVARDDTRRLGDFELISEIGRGGMGVVYEARQISLDRRVAVKVLPFAAVLNARQIARFKHEAQAAAQLHHPNIVPVFAIGVERGVHYYAMQFVDGQPLDRAISELRERRTRRAPGAKTTSSLASSSRREYFRNIMRLGIQAAEALHAAHEFGIVHRDIKPSNLLLETGGQLWVTDFGLARFDRDVTLTRSGDLVGTLRYMSPEQAGGQSAMVDQRTDIYSLGITLYELLALRPAFAEKDGPGLLRQIELHDPPKLRQLRPEAPAELETVICKAIAKNRDERYATAQQLADDLRCVLDDKPTLAKPPTIFDRGLRFSRRHRRFVGLGVAAALLVIVGFVFSNVLITREKIRAEQNLARADEYFRDAREVVDKFGVALSQRLADLPEAQVVSRELLKETRDYYERFIEGAQHNPALRAEMALTYGKLAQLIEKVGSAEDSLTAHQLAVRLFEALAAENVKNLNHHQRLAVAQNNLALALARVGRAEEAERLFGKAIRRQEKLRSNLPGDQALIDSLATSLGNLGVLQSQLGRGDEATATLKRSHDLVQRRHALHPDDLELIQALASAANKLASMYLESSPAKAAELHQEADRLLVEALRTRPDDLFLQGDRALTLNNLAAAYSRMRHYHAALAHYEQAIEIQQALVRVSPASGVYRRELAVSENNAGLVHSRLGNGPDADAAFRRAIEIQEVLLKLSPSDLTLRSNLAGAYHNLGIVLEEAGRALEAATTFTLAVEHQQYAANVAPQIARYRRLLSAHHANQNRVKQRIASTDAHSIP